MLSEVNLTKAQLLDGVEGVTRSKKAARNTVQYWLADGTECIKYHDTVVVSKAPDGIVTLNSGGFRTMTTKDRIWEYGKVPIKQCCGIWHMPGGSAFYDGIRVRPGEAPYYGRCVIVSKIKEAEGAKVKKLKARIKKYCDLITPTKLPTPASGDCWYCLMKGAKSGNPKNEGKSLGDITGDHEHLWSHIEEGYVNGSLIVNAMEEAGYSINSIEYYYAFAESGATPSLQVIRRAVSKYLQRRLIVDISVR